MKTRAEMLGGFTLASVRRCLAKTYDRGREDDKTPRTDAIMKKHASAIERGIKRGALVGEIVIPIHKAEGGK